MKIALAMENFSPYGGGAESYAVSLAESFIRSGWEVHCYAKNWEGEPKQAVFHKISVANWLPSWCQMLSFAQQHRKMVLQEDFDVVLGFGNTITMNVYQSHGGVHWYSTFRKVYSEPNRILRFCKRLLVLLSPKHHVRNWIEAAPFRMKNMPTIIAISEMIRQDMAKYHKIDISKINLVYNGIDIAKFSSSIETQKQEARTRIRQIFGIEPDDVVFVLVSFELKKKGIEPLAAAAVQLKEQFGSKLRVLVVGAEPYRSLKRYIADNNLKKTLIFTGPQKSVADYYAASDVFVLPTYYDACSLSVLEAMVSGLPVITTETNGIAGILENGAGYVVPHPPLPDDIAGAMLQMMRTEERQKMAEKALLTGSKYTKEKNHAALISFCEQAAKAKNPYR